VHFGMLLVEAWCAYGVAFDVITSMHADLTGSDSVAFLESLLDAEKSANQKLTGKLKEGYVVKGYPPAKQRVLSTWPVNSMWTEFLIDMGINDEGAECAADQLSVFVRAIEWVGCGDKELPGFMAMLQLWYYGMPVEKVCSKKASRVHAFWKELARIVCIHAVENHGETFHRAVVWNCFVSRHGTCSKHCERCQWCHRGHVDTRSKVFCHVNCPRKHKVHRLEGNLGAPSWCEQDAARGKCSG
jgi:hypothetical protein